MSRECLKNILLTLVLAIAALAGCSAPSDDPNPRIIVDDATCSADECPDDDSPLAEPEPGVVTAPDPVDVCEVDYEGSRRCEFCEEGTAVRCSYCQPDRLDEDFATRCASDETCVEWTDASDNRPRADCRPQGTQACNPSVFERSCDDNAIVTCEDGLTSSTPCGEGLHCTSDINGEPTCLWEGIESCDVDDFARYCSDDGSAVIRCDGETATEYAVSCDPGEICHVSQSGLAVCALPEATPCDPETESYAACDGEHVVTCQSVGDGEGLVAIEACPPEYHCRDLISEQYAVGCIPLDSESCDPDTWVPVCEFGMLKLCGGSGWDYRTACAAPNECQTNADGMAACNVVGGQPCDPDVSPDPIAHCSDEGHPIVCAQNGLPTADVCRFGGTCVEMNDQAYCSQ